ncbi:MAG: DUF938 domain-containing protein [Sphingomonadaceae bacterium]
MTAPQPFVFAPTGEAKRFAPATERNREAIIAVLHDVLPEAGRVLEIASGTGEHVVAFARAFPALTWQPSDPDTAAIASIAAWSAEAGSANLLTPLTLDASAPEWPVASVNAVLCINMSHISPWTATQGLMAGAAARLAPGAPLYLYGPFLRDGVETAPGNVAFDASLRERNAEWGLRSVEAVCAEAAAHGFGFERLVEMPANNLSLVFSAAY